MGRRKAGHRLHQLVAEQRRQQRRAIGWRYVPAAAAYVALCSILLVVFAAVSPPEIVWMAAGFFVGASLLFLWVAADTPSAARLESAAFGEEHVSTELRKLAPAGWRVIDNMPFEYFDVDHIAIGPGGVLLFETKWSEDRWSGRIDPIRARAIDKMDRQVRRLAPAVNAVLRQHGSSAKVLGSAIVACGPHRPDTIARTAGNTRVVPLGELRAFVSALPPVLVANEVQEAHEALGTFVDKRRAAEPVR